MKYNFNIFLNKIPEKKKLEKYARIETRVDKNKYSVSFCIRIIQRRTSQDGQHQLEQSTSFSFYRQIRMSLKRGSSNHVAVMRNMQKALNVRRRAPWRTQSSSGLLFFNQDKIIFLIIDLREILKSIAL